MHKDIAGGQQNTVPANKFQMRQPRHFGAIRQSRSGTDSRRLPSLKVLDLSDTSIASLPSSLGLLKELAYLNLSSTHIQELPDSIGALTCIQFLNLSQCKELTCLPLTVSELKSLRSLILQGCEKLSVLGNEISQLTSLEMLTMDDSSIFIGEGSAEMERNEVCLKDLVNLRRLRELSLQVRSPITKGLLGGWINMKDLELDLGQTNQEDLPEDMQALDQLESFVLTGCSAGRLPDWIAGFQSLTVLLLHGRPQLTELPELTRLPSLKALIIGDCVGLRSLSMEGGSDGGFPALEMLGLTELPSVESIVRVLEDGAMPNLKRLWVKDCEKMKVLPLGIEKRLEIIRGSKDWWDGILWESDHVRNRLQNIYIVDW